jgi:hypothetical protein
VNKCSSILTANTRRLTRVSNRFEELGLHPTLIKFYKDLEPFYYLDPCDEGDEKFPNLKNYVANLDKDDQYEGEVDECGLSYGRGIRIFDNTDFVII